ncbi:unnamed protein product, partial [Urochloa humidicola]
MASSTEIPVQQILDESIEEANRSLEHQELLNQAQDMVIKNEQLKMADVPITKITGTFAMSALSNKGVKSAVVYSGKNKHGVECGWLLAFADTKGTERR